MKNKLLLSICLNISFLIVVSLNLAFSQDQYNFIETKGTQVQVEFYNNGYIVPFSYGAYRKDIEAFFGRGQVVGVGSGRTTIRHQNKGSWKWDFMDLTYIGEGAYSRLNEFVFYFDKFEHKNYLSKVLNSDKTVYSNCSIEMTTTKPGSGVTKTHQLGCADYIEYDYFTQKTETHRYIYNFPFIEKDGRFGKVALEYRF